MTWLGFVLVVSPAWSRDWRSVERFAVQLQAVQPAQVRASSFDLLIVDPMTDQGPLAPRELQTGGRLVVAYLSLGEAEDYRPYWRPEFRPGFPVWLGPANPDWPGNHPVMFWHPEWRRILEQSLDSLVSAGFDGVMLDRVDVYERHRRPAEMRSLVCALARRARERDPEFGVFPNNAEALLTDPEYRDAVTGIVREELFFTPGGPVPPEATQAALPLLRLLGDKPVLCVDYPRSPEEAQEAHRRARSEGFREYTGPLKLDRLAEQPAQPRAWGWLGLSVLGMAGMALGLARRRR